MQERETDKGGEIAGRKRRELRSDWLTDGGINRVQIMQGKKKNANEILDFESLKTFFANQFLSLHEHTVFCQSHNSLGDFYILFFSLV